jgi:hypothetical protein
MEELTEEQLAILDKALEKAGEITSLRWIYFADHKRIDPKIIKKLYELKELLDKLKVKEVV